MKPEHPDEALLEQSLAAWEVPEPSPDLAARILAHNAETLTALCTPTKPPTLEEVTPAMLPTAPPNARNESSLRPFWTAAVLGFAAAAAIVIAFMAGRQSTSAPVATPVVPEVNIQVAAPAPSVQPPAPPAPPALPEKIIAPETRDPVDPMPKARAPRSRSTSPDLKNPFGPSAGSPRTSKPGSSGGAKNLKNPFDRDDEAPGTLRLATASGSTPAEAFVDGKRVGMTPLSAVEVSPGKHTVVFRWASKSQTHKIEVGSGQTKVVLANDL